MCNGAATPPGSPSGAPSGILYVDLNPKSVCMNPAGQTVYQKQIEVYAGKISFRDNCADTLTPLATSDLTVSSAWPQLIAYQADIYVLQYSGFAPAIGTVTSFVEVYCHANPVADAEIYILTNSNGVSKNGAFSYRLTGAPQLVQFLVEGPTDGLYQDGQFSLKIDLNSTALLPDQYPGSLTIFGETQPVPVECRVVYPNLDNSLPSKL